MKVSAIMPAFGRHAATKDLLPRLLSSAGLDASEWELIVVVNGQSELTQMLQGVQGIRLLNSKTNLGYWGALKIGAARSASQLLVNLANDLLPGMDWLKRALDAYELTYQGTDGVIGFNDGVRLDQSAHFLVARSLLYKWYQADYWPIHYRHSWGDTELSLRAKRERKYAIAPFAVLFHANHPLLGGAVDDVYTLGAESFEQDAAVFEMRKANNWSSTPIAKGG